MLGDFERHQVDLCQMFIQHRLTLFDQKCWQWRRQLDNWGGGGGANIHAIFYQHLKNSLIIHEENTKEMNV